MDFCGPAFDPLGRLDGGSYTCESGDDEVEIAENALLLVTMPGALEMAWEMVASGQTQKAQPQHVKRKKKTI